ncbi:MAG: DUF1573 domain-containing protein [Saprospiraceae bacterium]
MTISIRIFTLACILFTGNVLRAQTDTVPDLKSMLNQLDSLQKEKVKEYAHHQSVYLKKTVEATCMQLDEKGRIKVAHYINVLQHPEDLKPTTVSWDRDTLPFGQINEGMILLDSFVVTNTGTEPYIIKSAKGNCDCTVVRLPTYPVMPGESAGVRIEFDSSKKAGHTTPAVILYDNSRPNKRNILYLDGYVIPGKDVKFIRGE